MISGSVVRSGGLLDEQSFQDRLVAGWSRCIADVGKSVFALDVAMTVRGLDKVLAGSTPRGATIFNSRARHPSALDELCAGYGIRMVPADAVASTDAGAGLAMLRAAAKCVEAEADAVIDHRELLAMEGELRSARGHLDALLARIDALRGA